MNGFSGGCNYTVILDGWFGDLADLRQENPAIAGYLLDWIAKMARPVPTPVSVVHLICEYLCVTTFGLAFHSGYKIRRGRSAPRYCDVCSEVVPREVSSLRGCLHSWVGLALTSVVDAVLCIVARHFEHPT